MVKRSGSMTHSQQLDLALMVCLDRRILLQATTVLQGVAPMPCGFDTSVTPQFSCYGTGRSATQMRHRQYCSRTVSSQALLFCGQPIQWQHKQLSAAGDEQMSDAILDTQASLLYDLA